MTRSWKIRKKNSDSKLKLRQMKCRLWRFLFTKKSLLYKRFKDDLYSYKSNMKHPKDKLIYLKPLTLLNTTRFFHAKKHFSTTLTRL